MRAALFALAALGAGITVTGCGSARNDPLDTKLLISPAPGDYEGPRDLLILNRRSEEIGCSLVQRGDCDALPDTELLVRLLPGERWEADDTTCTYTDIACWVGGVPEGPSDEPPLRYWTWNIDPPEDEE